MTRLNAKPNAHKKNANARASAEEKALKSGNNEARITMSKRDFRNIANAHEVAFSANPALEEAMLAAGKIKRS